MKLKIAPFCAVSCSWHPMCLSGYKLGCLMPSTNNFLLVFAVVVVCICLRAAMEQMKTQREKELILSGNFKYYKFRKMSTREVSWRCVKLSTKQLSAHHNLFLQN